MKFAKMSVTVTVIAFAIALLTAMPSFACEDDDCHSNWDKKPQSIVNVYNEDNVLAEINGGSLSIWEEGGTLENIAIGALAIVPATCGECPGGIKVDVVNVAPVIAVTNIGDATVAGPFNLTNIAIGAAAIGGKK